MDSPSTAPNSAPGSTSTLSLSSSDEQPRIKFLCSFNGSILPRPQDGKLRYVGGETRIVSVPRDITYTELMNRMRELFEGASVLKYQQPDEDLDALVSVVNDDDVTNMMEEYDKLGSGDGFTRLRIFLYAHPDQDGSLHYIDGDDRNSERRYVDALNNMNDVSDFRRQQVPESLMIGALDDMHLSEQFYSPRHSDIPVNLNHLSIPQMGLGQVQQPVRYSEMEGTWSPSYYSPRHHGHHEFPSSPSSVRYGMPLGELSDKCLDRLPDEYAWQQQVNPQSAHDHHHQHQFPENILWVPTSGSPSGDVGFPGNILHGPTAIDVNNIGRMSFDRNQTPHMEQPHLGNGLPELSNPREGYMLNPNMKLHHGNYPRDQKDPRILYSDPQERGGWVVPHQMNDYYVRDGPNMTFPIPHANLVDGQQGSTSFAHHPELGPASQNYVHHPEFNNEVFHDPAVAAYGVSNAHMLPHGHMHPQTLWRNVPNTGHGGQPYEVSRPPQPMNGQRTFVGVDSQNNQNYGHGLIVNPNNYFPENQHPRVLENQPPQPPAVFVPESSNGLNTAEETEKTPEAPNVAPLETNGFLDVKSLVNENGLTRIEGNSDKLAEPLKPLVDLSDIPQQLNPVKSSAFACEEDVKAEAEEVGLSVDKATTETETKEAELMNNQGDLGPASEDTINSSKIEPTKAEAEAIARGLQTIRNDDLEEIRELGSGTYGAVYHGKWRGSDVAIKRIKASCFAGKPSERERLIADFWREASILSSLHHPNVVAFYGIVRDGPDGSLATVTEFMVNGSLKQFLQKKDRTIDRRKRLIIAMDSAFGMEYLHGKNIVHFDLKCENLLVNMRDPQRPVCKIGDLGLSKVKQHTMVSGGVRGTLPWMAPELLSGKTNMVSEKIDVYSFGIVMWELLTGEEPYANMHCASIIGGIVNNSLRPEIPTWCDPEWKALMESCWSCDPLERPSFSEISQKLRSMAAAINVNASPKALYPPIKRS